MAAQDHEEIEKFQEAVIIRIVNTVGLTLLAVEITETFQLYMSLINTNWGRHSITWPTTRPRRSSSWRCKRVAGSMAGVEIISRQAGQAV